MVKKKNYSTPEVEVEMFTMDASIMTITTSDGLEGTGGEFVGGNDWEF